MRLWWRRVARGRRRGGREGGGGGGGAVRRRGGHPRRQQRKVTRRAFLPVHRQSDGYSSCSCCTGARCVQLRRRFWSFLRCPCSLQRQVLVELKVCQLQFIFCMPDIPVVLQRRVHSANCAADRRDPTGACAVLGGG